MSNVNITKQNLSLRKQIINNHMSWEGVTFAISVHLAPCSYQTQLIYKDLRVNGGQFAESFKCYHCEILCTLGAYNKKIELILDDKSDVNTYAGNAFNNQEPSQRGEVNEWTQKLWSLQIWDV